MTVEGLRCARHPGEETRLRCSRCETPVCPRCMAYTPVGIRCPSCARERRSGVNAVSPALLARAAGAALGVGVVAGLAWGAFPLYAFWVALLLGFGGGEAVNLAANRRRGPELRIVAAGMVAVAFLLAGFLGGAAFTGRIVFETLMAGVALYLAVQRQG